MSSGRLEIVAGLAKLAIGAWLVLDPVNATILLVQVAAAWVLAKTILSSRTRASGATLALALVACVGVLARPAEAALVVTGLVYYVVVAAATIAGLVDIAGGVQTSRWMRTCKGGLQVGMACLFVLEPGLGAMVMARLIGAVLVAVGVTVVPSVFRLLRTGEQVLR